MKYVRGFTVVELVVVITVVAILLTLAVANLRGTQISARDSERKTDIETIARHLEVFYQSGYVALSGQAEPGGRYPSTDFISGGNDLIYRVLSNINAKSLQAPNASGLSLVAATNNIETTSGVVPQPTISQYVYQALDGTNNVCTSGEICRRFNLYYRQESDNQIIRITSKNQ